MTDAAPATTQDDLQRRVEASFPLPLSVAARKLRQSEDAAHSKQVKQLGDLMEVLIKYLASIACRAYLIDDGENAQLNELLAQFNAPTLGKWIEMLRECGRLGKPPAIPNPLSDRVRDFYSAKLPGGKAHPVLVFAGALRDALGKPDMKIEPTNGQLLELYVTFRNAKLGHGATLSEPEYEAFFESLQPILQHLLDCAGFLVQFPLLYVQDVRVKNQVFVHRAESFMGRDFETAKFQTTTSALNDHEVYVCSMAEAAGAQTLTITFALSLSPYLIVEQCHECKQQQLFFFNAMKGKRLEYLSYQCGHDFSPAGYMADFDNIKEFLAGKVSTEELFRGKSFGREIAPRTLAVSREDKEEAHRKLERAKELARANSYTLAQEELAEALLLDADLAEAHFVFGCLSILQMANVEAAVSSLESAVRLDPENAAFLLALGRTLAALERYDEAGETLRRLLQVDPANREARRILPELPDGGPPSGGTA